MSLADEREYEALLEELEEELKSILSELVRRNFIDFAG